MGQKDSTPGKPPDTSASRTWLVPHVTSAGLEPIHQPRRWVIELLRALKSATLPIRSRGLPLQLAKTSGWMDRSYGCCMPAVAFCEPSTRTSTAKIFFESCHVKILMLRLFLHIIPAASGPRAILKSFVLFCSA